MLSPTGIWLVESISLSRLVAALLFAALAFQNLPLWIITVIYLVGMCSDLLDGYLARRLHATTYFGKILDLVSDKSLTIVSLLYAAARGISMLPLALIATREVIMIGARIIVINGKQLLPTNKILGGMISAVLWSNTLFLIVASQNETNIKIASVVYWSAAGFVTVNLTVRLYVRIPQIRAALRRE